MNRRIALVCSEPLRETMAGIGIRYVEMASHLAEVGFEIVLIHPASTPQALRLRLEKVTFETLAESTLFQRLETCDVVIAQGHLANQIATMNLAVAKVFDFYDPWLIENFSYVDTLGWKPFFNDLASWRLQFEHGDFFLCSSQTQRMFYLGFLTALGRVNPDQVQADPELKHLLAAVPFGIPDALPAHQPLLPPAEEDCKRILFGGLYDWYDPWTLLQALTQLEDKAWQVLFVDNPNPETTPQTLAKEVRKWAKEKGWLGQRVVFLDWIPMTRRFDLLRDVDVLVAPHCLSLETRLCMRTRYLDAIAVGCPAISSEGGTIADLLQQFDAGAVIPPQNPAALKRMLEQTLWQERTFTEGSARLKTALSWRKVLEPLIEFCKNPTQDQGKTIVKDLKDTSGKWGRRLHLLRRQWRKLLNLSASF